MVAWSIAPAEATVTEEQGLRVMLAAACRRLHARGLLAGAEGNLSCRLPNGDVLVTASGVDKGAIDHTHVLRVHADGALWREARAHAPTGDPQPSDTTRRPSSELGMHLACYAARADVQAIVHAHPPAATGFAAAGIPIPADVLPELPVVVGPIAMVPYGRPGTPALADAMRPFLASHEVFLLANHGVTALGRSIEDALLRMESVEQSARILAVAHLLGGAKSLPPVEAAVLASLHPRYEDTARTNIG
ncbi:MAG: aldolase [Gemmatimonadetes bacterium]|nr:MAG: aldolase [Gemmatimonadota bacterium]